jgi:hypothetical protein
VAVGARWFINYRLRLNISPIERIRSQSFHSQIRAASGGILFYRWHYGGIVFINSRGPINRKINITEWREIGGQHRDASFEATSLVVGGGTSGVLVCSCRVRHGGVVIAVRVDTSSLGLSVVTAVGTVCGSNGDSRSAVSVGTVDLVVLVAGSSDCASGVASLVRGTEVVGVAGNEAAISNSSASGTELSILVDPLAVPEVALGGTGSVVVGRAGTEALLLLVLADKDDLHEGGDDEEDDGDDGDGEGGGVQAAGSARGDRVGEVLALASADAVVTEAIGVVQPGVAATKRGVNDSSAGAGTVAGQDGDGNEATDEEDVEKDGGEGEEGDATEAAGEDNCSDGVEDSNTGDALDGLFPGRDALIAVCAHGKEVGVDAFGELAYVDSTRRDR